MSFISLTSADVRVDKAITSTLLKKIRTNIEWLKNAYQYNCENIANSDFEYMTDGLPDMWDCATYDEGFVGTNTSTSVSGRNCIMFVHDGSTKSGGEAVSDYFPMTTLSDLDFNVQYYLWGDTVVDLKVNLTMYQGNKTAISTVTVTTHHTGWPIPTQYNATFLKAAGVRWGKVRFECSTTTTAAGTLYIDNVYAGYISGATKLPY